MKFFTLLFVALLILLPLQAASAQTTGQQFAYDDQSSPVDLLASYYNAINLQDYSRAYGYWDNPTQTYEQFASGFAQTASVQLIVQPPTFVDAAAGSRYTQIPAIVIAATRSGGMQMFVGCFFVRRSNLQPPDVPADAVLWRIDRARLAQVMLTSSIPTLLAEACPPL